MKLKEVIDLWLPEKKRQVKESTFSAYSLTCSRILIPTFGEMEVSSIDKIAVRTFAYRELETKSAKTVKDILIVLKMLMNFAAEELDQSIPSLTWKIVWPSSNLDNHSNSKIETRLIESTPKTKNSRRDVPIIPKLKKMLKAFSAISKPEYFINSGNIRCCEPRVFRNQAARLVEASGVSPVLKFHALRHTFASTLIENHIDPKTVSAILGHSNVAITLNLYVHPSDQAKADAISKGLRGLL